MKIEVWVAPQLEVPAGYSESIIQFKGIPKIPGVRLKLSMTFSSPGDGNSPGTSVTVSETAVSLRKGPIPAFVFEPPPDYKPVQPVAK